MIANGAPPQDTPNQLGDHRLHRNVLRTFSCGKSRRGMRLDTPFRRLSSTDSDTFGG